MKLFDANGMIGAYTRERVPIAGEEQYFQLAKRMALRNRLCTTWMPVHLIPW